MRIKCPRCAGAISIEAGELPQAGVRCTCPACGKPVHLMPRAAWSAGRNQPDALGPVPEPPPTVQPPPVPTGRTWVIAGIGMILLVLGLAVAAGVIFAGASPGTAVAAGR